MRVLVMGAGVVGVTAVWQLLEDGHEVVVIERRDEAAAETSFANAGLVAPGHAFAWASPKAAGNSLKSLACGTARACADLIGGLPPEVPLEGLTLR